MKIVVNKFSRHDLERRLMEIESKIHWSVLLDPIGEPDFALWNAGGRIIPDYTSLTFDPDKDTETDRKRKFFAFNRNRQLSSEGRWGRFPEHAISTVLQPGNCWPLMGSEGSIGISLSRTMRPTSFTVEHLPPRLAFDTSTAPREFEVWGILNEAFPLPNSNQYHDIISSPNIHWPTLSRSRSKNHIFLLLAQYSYEIDASRHVQNFPILPSLAHEQFAVHSVIFVIKNNWGHDNLTCIYRLRAHGMQLD